MFIQQLYTNCLAQAAYYVESEGEAILIDPLRDVRPYMELAKQRGATIKYVFETHFHADFISGHIELARQTGAQIVYGPNAKPGYAAMIAYDHEKFKLGKITLEVLHTPGHTIESSCFLLYDENNKINSVFTGDCLFVGDVGRPDLLSGNLSKEELAGMLYDSLNNKIKPLPDDVIVYPGHGAGSACGKNIGKETVTTIGQQKKYNYALQDMRKADFVKTITDELPDPPPYFFIDAKINIEGYGTYDKVVETASKAIHIKEFLEEVSNGAFLLDTRTSAEFGDGYIPGSVNIGLDGGFAVWAGSLIKFGTPIVLITAIGKEQESIMRLARIGYDNIKGYLQGGIESWQRSENPINTIRQLETNELEDYLNTGEYTLVDVRNKLEINTNGKLKNSLFIPLGEIMSNLSKFNKDESYIIYCVGGYRSMIAASILKKAGMKNIFSLKGGINKIIEDIPELISMELS